eukprot:g16907.t1
MVRLRSNRLESLLIPLIFVFGPPATAKETWPSLSVASQVLLTTLGDDFEGDDASFGAATAWHGDRLRESPSRRAPHLACAEYGEGKQAMRKLEGLFSESALRLVSNSKDHGTCFFVTASASHAATVSLDLEAYGLASFGPVPSAMKLAPGLLNHDGRPPGRGSSSAGEEGQPKRLATTHGPRMRFENVVGLDVSLSPGVLPARDPRGGAFISELLDGLMSTSVDLHASNFWSDATLPEDKQAGPAGVLRSWEWKRAADVVHELSTEGGPTPGDVCSWGDLRVHHTGSDLLMIKGMDHLLHLGRGAGGKRGAESDELQMACLMGLVSLLAAVPEVQRISPLHASELKNAVAGAIIQSGTTAGKPLTEAGLDGTGEVIQIIDTGLDETSCFFVDEDGLEVEHGYYFEELGFAGEPSFDNVISLFEGGSFPFDLSRRKIVQYIRLVREDYAGSPYGETFATTRGGAFSWYEESGFGFDMEAGHGTHTAGTAAGSTLGKPAETVTCEAGSEVGCIGKCVTTWGAAEAAADSLLTWDTLCPQFNCDGLTGACLSEDVSETLTDNGGIARGAKLAVFDVSIDGNAVWASLAENGLWDATKDTGCMLHSNSWGGDYDCNMDAETATFDQYMYENPEHLLIFAAGNEGEPTDSGRTSCTINIPGIGKNVLAVGASSSGPTRWPLTADDGDVIEAYGKDQSDIDMVSFFSSYGPSRDFRIKPEVVAPGDQVLSAGSDGTDGHSCQLTALFGTSMATPVVAGAAAMVRQYFKNSSFYEDDVTRRGLCAESSNANYTNAFTCEAFSPSAATVKALLINSADLMGQSSEPDAHRGFGRVHLEGGLPMDAEGDMALFVADAFETEIEERTIHEYRFELLPNTDLELRSTLSWLDPPVAAEASQQMLNDLDLTVVAPDGSTLYRMWSDGADVKNVNERVIISSSVATGGTWIVAVSCFDLTTDTQPYSLVVTGPIDVDSGGFSQREATGAAMGRATPSVFALCMSAFATLVGAVVVVMS